MKYPRIIIAITILTLSSLIGSVSFAFIGPGSLTPGTGNGALQVDSNLNIGFGTNLATPTGDATNALFGRVFTIASTSDPGISLRNLGGGRNYTMYSRANGRFVIWDDFSSRPRFFIDANGFVGISGNSTSTYFFTPASALHVAGSIQSDAAFVGAVAPSSITGGAFQSSNYAFPSAVGVGTSTTSGLPTGGMYVAGNVGIGTVSPGAKLDVMGSDADNAVLARFYANTSSRGSFIIRNGTGSNPTTFIGTAGSNEHLAIGAVNTERIRIAPGGNVGIGSTSPNAPLEIGTQGSIQGANVNLILSGSGGYPGIQFWNASGVSRTIIRQDSTNDRLAIFTNTGTAAVPVLTEKITLLNSGNFGIGVAAPTAKLHIYGEGATDMIKMTANYATPQVWTQYVDSGGWYLKQDATFPFHVHSGGNVGIGTNTPGQKLTVAGVIESTTGGIKFPDGTTQVTAGGGTGTSVGWSRTGTNVYLTTSTDWVGVGTTTPTQALDVRGNIYVSGNIVTGGTMTTNVGASNVSAGSFGTTAGKGNYRFEGAATTNDVLKVDATNERVGVGTASPMYTMQVGQNTAGIDTNYGIGILRNGTNVTPGTYDNAALDILDWAGDGPTSGIDGVGVLAVRAGRIADGDTYASNASLVRISNDNGGAMRIDGKRNTFIGYMTDAASTQTAGLFVNGNVGVGTTGPGSKLHVVGVTSLGVGGTVPGSSTTGLNLTAVAGSAGTASTGIYFGGDGVAHANIAWMPNERNFILRTGNSSTQTTDSYGGANLVVNGKIGIGTTNPGTSLEVLSIAPDANRTIPQNILTITSQQNNAPYSGFGGGILFKDQMYNLGINNSARIRTSINYDGYVGQEYGGSLAFDVTPTVGGALTEAMRIRYNGNIGIGTTTPTNALDVVGNIRATGNIVSGGTMTANVGAPNVSAGTFGTTAGKGNYTFEAAANTNNVLKVDATNERVGVGTASPATSLHVKGTGWTDNTVGSSLLRLESTDAVGAGIAMKNTNGNYWNIYNGGASSWAGQGKLSFVYSDGVTAATGPKMVIDTSGNVGIGTNTPSQKLEVNGNIKLTSGGYVYGDGSNAYLYLSNAGGSRLAYSPSVYLEALAASVNIKASSEPIAIWNNNGNIRLAADGNVGIGTTSPGAKLQVQGAIKTQNIVPSSPDQNFRRTINVASYEGGGTIRTGILTIKLPTPLVHSMGKIKVSGWSYGQSWEIDLSGYMHPGTGSGWTQVGGTVVSGNPPFTPSQVKLVAETTTSDTFYILLGNASTNWGYYASVGVDIDSYYSDGLISTGWDISIAASEPAYDTSVVPNVSLYGSSNALISSSVGIGTTTPTNALDVVGNIRATGNIIAGGTMTANVSAPNVSAGTFGTTAGKGNYTFEAAANTNNVLKVDATNERVGIGTGSPGMRLDVVGDIRGSTDLWLDGSDRARSIYLKYNSSSWPNYSSYITQTGGADLAGTQGLVINENIGQALSNYGIGFAIGGANKMFIQHTGNIGIGSTSPNYKLSLGSNTANTKLALWDGGAGVSYGLGVQSEQFRLNLPASSARFSFLNTESSGEIVTMLGTGNVGIGTTTPAYKLDVAGVIRSNAANVGTLSLGTDSFSSTYTTAQVIGQTSPNYTSTGKLSFKVLTWGVGSDYGPTEQMSINVTGPDTKAATIIMAPNGGKVGIGTSTAPTYMLDVLGTGSFANPVIVGSPTAANHATTRSYVDSLVTGGATSGNLATLIVTGTTTLASTGGKVIIGGAGPALKLDVTGQGQFTDTMSATKYYDYNDTAYYLDPANTGTSLKLAGSLESGGSGTSYVLGNTLIGVSTNPGSYKFAVSGTSYFNNQVTIAANLLMGASQNITLQSGNITGVNKITAAVIDPLYEIDGEKYATYGSDTVGVKTELFAKAKLSQSRTYPVESIKYENKDTKYDIQNTIYNYVIDFARAERGSDLWVFWQTIKEGNDMKDITLTLTPEGKPAELWYELNPKEKQVVVYGDAPVTFSYHLVAPRHDAETWTTKRGKTEEKASFILKAR